MTMFGRGPLSLRLGCTSVSWLWANAVSLTYQSVGRAPSQSTRGALWVSERAIGWWFINNCSDTTRLSGVPMILLRRNAQPPARRMGVIVAIGVLLMQTQSGTTTSPRATPKASLMRVPTLQ